MHTEKLLNAKPDHLFSWIKKCFCDLLWVPFEMERWQSLQFTRTLMSWRGIVYLNNYQISTLQSLKIDSLNTFNQHPQSRIQHLWIHICPTHSLVFPEQLVQNDYTNHVPVAPAWKNQKTSELLFLITNKHIMQNFVGEWDCWKPVRPSICFLHSPVILPLRIKRANKDANTLTNINIS